jgi:hypothetical protein
MSRLFDRVVVLQIDNESFSEFRINFRIAKTPRGEPNEARIQIYGLSRPSVSKFLSVGREARVRLLAGYGGAPSLLFEGSPIADGIQLVKTGPERILDIKCLDGIRSYQRARVNFTFERGTTYGQLIEKTLGQMGLPLGIIDRENPDWNRAVESSAVLEGRAADVLDRLADTLKSQWSIQDGKLQFIREGRSRTNRGPEYSPKYRNVINSPSVKDKGKIEVTTLLNPITPGDRFSLTGFEDPRFQGLYRAENVNHAGDSGFESTFYTTIEASKLPQPR